jgi:hypothetical protein
MTDTPPPNAPVPPPPSAPVPPYPEVTDRVPPQDAVPPADGIPPQPPGPADAPAYGRGQGYPLQPMPQQMPDPVPGRSGMAVASLVLSLLGLFPLGLILGIVALVRIGRTRQQGKVLAILRVVFSGLWLLVSVLSALLAAFYLSTSVHRSALPHSVRAAAAGRGHAAGHLLQPARGRAVRGLGQRRALLRHARAAAVRPDHHDRAVPGPRRSEAAVADRLQPGSLPGLHRPLGTWRQRRGAPLLLPSRARLADRKG